MSDKVQNRAGVAEVFIVEDHDMMRAMLAALIAAQPTVNLAGVARTGEEALVELKRTKADIVIVDVTLDGMNGFDFIQQLRLIRPEVRCLLVSGHSSIQYVQRARNVGAQGYVVKGDSKRFCTGLAEILADRQYFPDSSESA